MGFPYDAVRRTVSDPIFAIHTRSCSGRFGALYAAGWILVLGGLGASSEAVQIVERA